MSEHGMNATVQIRNRMFTLVEFVMPERPIVTGVHDEQAYQLNLVSTYDPSEDDVAITIPIRGDLYDMLARCVSDPANNRIALMLITSDVVYTPVPPVSNQLDTNST